MELNVNQLVRSGVVLVIGLPLTIGTLFAQLPKETDRVEQIKTEFKAELAKPCLNYLFSKSDSKLERTAKNAIDSRLGGGVDYTNVCKFALS